MSSIKKDEKFLERFKLAVAKIGGNDSAARVMGKSVKSIERYKAGGEPSFGDMRCLSMASGLPIEWLAFGLDEDLEPRPKSNQLVDIPVLNVSASAGGGRLITEYDEVGGYIQFNQQWLNEFGFKKSELFTIPTVGESMEPTIMAGEYLLCSRSLRHTTVGDGVYVIRIGDSILVKRLQVMMDNIVIVSSDNSTFYKSQKIDLKKNPDFQVLGKVILVHGVRWF